MELSQKESQAIQPNKPFVNKINASHNKGRAKSNDFKSRSRSNSQVAQRSSKDNRSFNKECRRCGRLHNPNSCPAVNWECYVCHKKGHTSKMCFSKNSSDNTNKSGGQFKRKQSNIGSFMVDGDLEDEIARINVVNRKKFKAERFLDREPEERTLNVEGQDLDMEVDSGAFLVISKEEYDERFGHIKLSPVSNKFKVLTGENINVIGKVDVHVFFNGVVNLLSLLVVATDGFVRALLGRPWLNVLQPNWRNSLLCRESNKVNLGSEKSMSIQDKINKLPLDVIFRFKPRTLLDLINDKKKIDLDTSRNEEIIQNCTPKSIVNENLKNKNGNIVNESKFKVGDKVLYRNHFKSSVRWIPARVVQIVSRHTYKIDVFSNIRFVHENQIRKSSLEDKHHPSLTRNLNDSSQVTKCSTPKSVKSSPKSVSPNSSQEYKTPLSSPVNPQSVNLSEKKVTFRIPEAVSNGSRGRAQSLSEEEGWRRSTRRRWNPVRYGSESDK